MFTNLFGMIFVLSGTMRFSLLLGCTTEYWALPSTTAERANHHKHHYNHNALVDKFQTS